MTADLKELHERIDRIEKDKVSMDTFKEAFPEGDHHGHCDYHKVMMAQFEERRKLRIAIQEKTISGLAWAGIVFFGTKILNALKLTYWHPQ